MIIYKITNLINNKIYIGKTEKTLKERWKNHIKHVGKVNRVLYDSMNKYGIENFKIECIEFNLNEFNIDEREIFWINELKSEFKYGNYNMTPGGGGGNTLKYHPNKEEIWRKQAKQRRGKKKSVEFCQRMSEIHKGKTISKETRKQISKTIKEKYRNGELKIIPPTPKHGKEHHGWIKIDVEDVINKIKLGYTSKEIAKIYNMATATLSLKLKNEIGKGYKGLVDEYSIKRKIKYPKTRKSRLSNSNWK